ncbi:MAG: TA system VapC family ribonuclease toxin [Burkholderiales bacterium]
MTPDVNVLLAASRADHAHHKAAYRWLISAIAACATGGSVKLMPVVATSFLRLTTHAKIFVQPTPIAGAVAFVDSLLSIPGVEMPACGPEWRILRTLCLDQNLVSNPIPDAWLAAAVLHANEHLVTFDRDFKKLLPRSQLTILATA